MSDSTTRTHTGPQRRISLVRLLFVAVVASALFYGTALAFTNWQASESVAGYKPWFAAYVDVTLTPTYAFEQRATSTASDVVLAFIVSSPSNPCTPSWGGAYTMQGAADNLDLDRRIARFQQQGGKIAISFGGVRNSELALHCTDTKALESAYQSVVLRYKVNTIDLDLENESLADAGASARRAAAIAQLQAAYKKEGKDLAIWLTLPVSPQGLSQAGTDAVAQMLKSGVDLAGVNVMTMDYGASRDSGDSMATASEKALTQTHSQLGILYQQAGINLNSDSLWTKIGATPMLGQNDEAGEVFTLDDAEALNRFARGSGVGRMSMWSANRDIPCGANYVDVKVVSNLCSGVSSPQYAFARALAKGFGGSLVQNAQMITVADPTSTTPVVDNPKTAPYQIWQKSGTYLKDTKVVWHGNVYQAKWWTKGDLPDNPVLQEWQTPWTLIGPVLPSDTPVKLLTLPRGTYPQWYGGAVYQAGDHVLFEGMPYFAKWWNQGQSPAAAAANPDNSPWVPLTQKDIMRIRSAMGLAN